MIRRIELKNFMSHTHTVIEPARGLTVLTGPNNCGKSAIVTALQILCYNDESTFVLRHGEKECSIRVVTDDGHDIEWIRQKNRSPKYVIDGITFDRLGGKTPEALRRILHIERVKSDGTESFDVHFGSQKSPTFLLNDSPRAAAQFFASSSDAANLMAMQRLHQQNTQSRRREKNRLDLENRDLDRQLEALVPVPEIEKLMATAERQQKQIRTTDEDAIAIVNLSHAIRETDSEFAGLNRLHGAMVELCAPPRLAPAGDLERLSGLIAGNELEIDECELRALALASLPHPPKPGDSTTLEQLLDRLTALESELTEADSKAKALKALLPVPNPHAETPLQNVVGQMERCEATCKDSVDALEVLNRLEPPVEDSQQKELSSHAELFRQQAKAFQRESDQLERTRVELGNLQRETEQWLKENPICPTCGSEISGCDVSLHAEGKP